MQFFISQIPSSFFFRFVLHFSLFNNNIMCNVCLTRCLISAEIEIKCKLYNQLLCRVEWKSGNEEWKEFKCEEFLWAFSLSRASLYKRLTFRRGFYGSNWSESPYIIYYVPSLSFLYSHWKLFISFILLLNLFLLDRLISRVLNFFTGGSIFFWHEIH